MFPTPKLLSDPELDEFGNRNLPHVKKNKTNSSLEDSGLNPKVDTQQIYKLRNANPNRPISITITLVQTSASVSEASHLVQAELAYGHVATSYDLDVSGHIVENVLVLGAVAHM